MWKRQSVIGLYDFKIHEIEILNAYESEDSKRFRGRG